MKLSELTDNELLDEIKKRTQKPAFKCCLCGGFFSGYGNNPDPLGKLPERCCNACDNSKVIPARLAMLADIKKEDSTNDKHAHVFQSDEVTP